MWRTLFKPWYGILVFWNSISSSYPTMIYIRHRWRKEAHKDLHAKMCPLSGVLPKNCPPQAMLFCIDPVKEPKFFDRSDSLHTFWQFGCDTSASEPSWGSYWRSRRVQEIIGTSFSRCPKGVSGFEQLMPISLQRREASLQPQALYCRVSRDHMNIRLLRTISSGLALVLGLRANM